MRFTRDILPLIVVMLIVVSCGGNKRGAVDVDPIEIGSGEMAVQGLPFRESSSKLWGMIAPDGKVIFEPKLTEVPTVAVNNRFWAQDTTDRYTLCDISGAPIMTADSLQKYESVSPFYHGRAFVKPVGADIAIIDTLGNIVATLAEIDGQKPEIISDINEGVGVFNMGKKFGAIDLNARIILPAEYAAVGPYKSGKIIACSENNFAHSDYTYIPDIDPDSAYNVETSTATVYDINGESILTISSDTYPIIYDRFFGDYLPVAKKFGNSYGWGFIDVMGKEIVAPQEDFKCFFDMRGEYYIYSNEKGLAGVKKLDGTIVINPEYDYMEFVSDNLISAQAPEAMGLELLNLQGAIVATDFAGISQFFPTDYKYAALETSSNGWSLIDTTGKPFDIDRKISEIIYLTLGSGSVRASEPN